MAKKNKSDSLDDTIRALTICAENIRKLETTVSDPRRLIERIELDTLHRVGELRVLAEISLDQCRDTLSGKAADDLAEIEGLAEDLSERFSAVFTAYCRRLKVEVELTYSDGSGEQALEAWNRPESHRVMDELRAAALLQRVDTGAHNWSDYYPTQDLAKQCKRSPSALRKTIAREIEAGRARRHPKSPERGPVSLRDDLARELSVPLRSANDQRSLNNDSAS